MYDYQVPTRRKDDEVKQWPQVLSRIARVGCVDTARLLDVLRRSIEAIEK